MNAETKHTPLPWVFAYGSIYRADTLHDESSIRIALMDRNEPHTMPTERDENARFICRAVNSHAYLLEACKRVAEFLQAWASTPKANNLNRAVAFEQESAWLKSIIQKAEAQS